MASSLDCNASYTVCRECYTLNENKYDKENKIKCVNCNKMILNKLKEGTFDSKPCEYVDNKNNIKCRLCFDNIKNEVFSIWGKDGISYSKKILDCCSIDVSKDEELPKTLCKHCVTKLNTAYEFRKMCLEKYANISEIKTKNKINFVNCETKILPELNKLVNIESNNLSDAELDEFSEDNDSDVSSKYLCSTCPMACDTEKEFEIHKRSHSARRRIKIHNNPKILCQVDGCKMEFDKFKDRENHEISCQRDKTKIYKYICPYCAQLIKRLRSFQYHLQYLHSSSEKKNKCCDKCQKKMNVETIKSHIRKVHHSETVKCEECGLLLSKYSIKRHLNSIHRIKDTYKCQLCDKRFATKWNLQVHVRIHTGELLYTCPDCKMGFSHSVLMKNHRLHIHNVNMFRKDFNENSK